MYSVSPTTRRAPCSCSVPRMSRSVAPVGCCRLKSKGPIGHHVDRLHSDPLRQWRARSRTPRRSHLLTLPAARRGPESCRRRVFSALALAPSKLRRTSSRSLRAWEICIVSMGPHSEFAFVCPFIVSIVASPNACTCLIPESPLVRRAHGLQLHLQRLDLMWSITVTS